MSRLVWTGVNKTAAHYRRRPRDRGVTLPHIPSLTRKHPVPDIEDRIREVKSNGGYHDVTKFERRPEK